jgi:hypothetical protein
MMSKILLCRLLCSLGLDVEGGGDVHKQVDAELEPTFHEDPLCNQMMISPNEVLTLSE